MDILKDVLLDAGLVENYFDVKVPVNLWRAWNSKETAHPMDLVEKAFSRGNGMVRAADIEIKPVNGDPWVFVKYRPRGASAFDRPRAFKGSHWRYFLLPAGTELPPGLAIVKDEYYQRYRATHYTLAPARDMPLATFRELLRQLFEKMVKEVG
ncbi:MAG TPA: hypothetical protein VF950_03375 [Planctomycetota bacterium]